MTYTPDQLHNAIESGLAHGDSELAQLVRLARRLGPLAPAGPTPDASRRMRLQFEAVMAGEGRRRFAGLWPFAVGAPSLHRPSLAQRFAAGALVLSALGGTASVATGVSPAEAARATVRVLASAAQNLAPHTVLQELDITEPAVPTPDPAATSGAQPSVHVPAANADPGSSATPDPSSTPVPGVAGTPGGTPSGTPGTNTPTATPTPTSNAAPSSAPDFPPGPALPVNPPATQGPATPVPTATPTKPPVFNPGGTPTPTSTPTPTATPTSTETPTPTPTNTPTRTPTATPTKDDHEEEDH